MSFHSRLHYNANSAFPSPSLLSIILSDLKSLESCVNVVGLKAADNFVPKSIAEAQVTKIIEQLLVDEIL